jgi:myo-inositol-1-phosphate synthase
MANKKIKIGIIGVGNCASSLIQGLEYYNNSNIHTNSVGILHPKISQYSINDIECVAAFDVDKRKVGRDISEAIFLSPNCTLKFSDVPFKGVEVKKSPVFDGISDNLKSIIKTNPNQKPENVSKVLRNSGAEILINYLPSGSQKATEYFVKEAIKAGCGFINVIPVFIASNKAFSKKFSDAKLPLAGDDIKSQIGSTILNRAMLELFKLRGVKIEKCTQTCEGGNTDFLNLSEMNRAKNKIISKSAALTEIIDYKTDIEIIPPRYIEGQKDKKTSSISMRGKYFGNATVNIKVNLEVEDSPDSAGVMVDVIRLMKIAFDKEFYGTIEDICSFYFKHPPKQYEDHQAYEKIRKFIDT